MSGTFVGLTNRQILSKTSIKDRFFDFLRGLVNSHSSDIWNDANNYGYLKTAIALTADTNDTFDVPALHGMVNDVANSGRHIELAAQNNVPFENTNLTVYHVGVRYAEKPTDVLTNLQSGLPNYTIYQETCGESGDPDLVTNPAPGTIHMHLNTVAGADQTNVGRTVTGWLKTPASADIATAVLTGVIAWDGANTFVNFAGEFGQGTPSVIAADYTVLIEGVSVSQAVDLLASAWYIALGDITGNGPAAIPAAFDHSRQRVATFGMGNLSDIITPCAHGIAKVDVKHNCAGANEAQISVHDAGVLTFSVDEDGDVRGPAANGNRMRVTTGIERTDAAPAALELKDQNTAAAIPLSSATDTAFVGGPGTLLGNLNQAFNGGVTSQDTLQIDCVVSGMAPTAGAGLSMNVAAGVVYADALQSAYAGGAFAMTDNATRYLYLSAAGALAEDAAWANATADGCVVLARVVTFAGAITSVLDLRRWACTIANRNADYTIGTANAQFRSFEAAFHWCTNMGVATVTVVTSMTVAASIQVPSINGFTVRATRDVTISWNMAGPLFILTGNYDTTFDNLYLVCTRVGDAATDECVCFSNTAAGPFCYSPYRVHIKNIRSSGTFYRGFLNFTLGGAAATTPGLLVENCHVEGVTDFGVVFDRVDQDYDSIRILNNTLVHGTAAHGATQAGIYVGRVTGNVDGAYVEGNRIVGFTNGIHVGESNLNVFLRRNILNDNTGTGILVDQLCENVNLDDNHVDGGATGISVHGSTSVSLRENKVGQHLAPTGDAYVLHSLVSLTLDGNLCYAAGAVGFNIDDVANSSLFGNIVKTAEGVAMAVTSLINSAFFGNTAVSHTDDCSAITFDAACAGVAITGNRGTAAGNTTGGGVTICGIDCLATGSTLVGNVGVASGGGGGGAYYGIRLNAATSLATSNVSSPAINCPAGFYLTPAGANPVALNA